MKLPENYYHCFMGNGLDAVLIGYTGSMVADKICVDRCNWYKSDRYYPENKLVKVAGRFPMDKKLEHGEGSGWFEVAPLGRTWYEVSYNGKKLELVDSKQQFVPQEGVLYTDLDFGLVKAKVVTFMNAFNSLLVEHYEFSHTVEFKSFMAPGVWVEEDWDTDPFLSVQMDGKKSRGSYDLGETHGNYFLELLPTPSRRDADGNGCVQVATGESFTKYFSILDDRQGKEEEADFQKMIAPGFEMILRAHKAFWQNYFSRSSIQIPDEQFQYFYDAAQYHFKAIQNPVSGGLPVNNLRRTWSSHVFWDAYYVEYAMLLANHLPEALEGCRFFLRTQEAARRHAESEFSAPGLKWDWEVTHDGRKAYGSLLHMKFQVHNNGSYSNMIWRYYQTTQDVNALRELFPILEGLAVFFMNGIVIHTERGWEIGPLVGVHESPNKVRNEGTTLAGIIDIFENFAIASSILGNATDFSAKCVEVAAGLRKTLDTLYNGKFFIAAEGYDEWNMSSIAVMYPMCVVAPRDPRALRTADEIIRKIDIVPIHHGQKWESPWSAGVEATILAIQGMGDDAWRRIETSRTGLCNFGGMTEVRMDNVWNMQYFCTGEAAVVTALHYLLLQGSDKTLSLFPAGPSGWKECAFDKLVNHGFEVSASYHNGSISGRIKNIAAQTLQTTLTVNAKEIPLQLKPGEEYVIEKA
ncbi:MAG: hypothetical protein VB013_01510 [Anaerolineaceae bacterium]|nr:hypothetical protein [Anaerolineaceae bacterium]